MIDRQIDGWTDGQKDRVEKDGEEMKGGRKETEKREGKRERDGEK